MLSDNYNDERPLIMHIDLNSCFATVEQQSRPMLRGRPVAIVNRRTENTSIVAASYEAKAFGVGVGMKVKDALRLCPDLVPLESDPPKYRFVYHKLLDIMKSYSAHVTMKSIDEGVIDFHHTTPEVRGRDMREIGEEIKERLKREVGCAMRCNVGIAPNRFLAKTAAGLHKPDGLDVIDYMSLRPTLSRLQLIDLCGIAKHNQKRLNSVGIFTPLEFLDAPESVLRSMVFKSICGTQWHQRLRGHEVDDEARNLKTVGRQYVLEDRQLSHAAITQRLHHLSESVGAKLRSQNKVARGVLVYAKTTERGYWHARGVRPMPFFSDRAIYTQARLLFRDVPAGIFEIGVSCYLLEDDLGDQLSFFGDEMAREQSITDAVDEINQRFGTRTIHAADTLGVGRHMQQKIPFGSTRYL